MRITFVPSGLNAQIKSVKSHVKTFCHKKMKVFSINAIASVAHDGG